MNDATILHADVDSFFASVEQRDDPSLRGRPVIVGAGVVLAASYEAKAYGVRTAMGGRQARRLCPQAVVVSPRMAAYSEASRAMFRVFEDATPLVEGLSIDEAFLDVRGMQRLAGSPVEIAARLRRDVWERVGLPITVGVARTKFLAKVASGVAKPDGLLVVPPDRELDFLHPLPVERLWGVGPKTAARLHDCGIRTVGQAAELTQEALVAMLGRATGRQVHALAHNHDRRRVRTGRRRGSIGSQRALGWRRRTSAEIDATLVALADRVTGRMRRAGRAGRTVVLRIRFDDLTRATRSRTLPRATAETDVVLRVARELLAVCAPLVAERGLKLVLPFDAAGGAALDAAVDEIRERYGSSAILRAVLVGRRPGLAMPLLPD
jgi:DNA polymerase-4